MNTTLILPNPTKLSEEQQNELIALLQENDFREEWDGSGIEKYHLEDESEILKAYSRDAAEEADTELLNFAEKHGILMAVHTELTEDVSNYNLAGSLGWYDPETKRFGEFATGANDIEPLMYLHHVRKLVSTPEKEAAFFQDCDALQKLGILPDPHA